MGEEHEKNARPSSREKHEKGQKRKGKAAGGEKGDKRRANGTGRNRIREGFA